MIDNYELVLKIVNAAIKGENLDLSNQHENKEKIELDDRKLRLFLNGVQLTSDKKEGIYKIYNNNKFIGIGIVENKLLKRDIVL